MKLMTRKRERPLTRQAGTVQAEIRQRMATLKPLVHAVAAMFGPHLEVVLHNLQNPKHSIVAIANGHVTGRKVGDPIIGGPFNDKGFALLRAPGEEARALVNYSTKSRDGRELKSATIVYYSQLTGRPSVALCLNLDLTSFQAIRSTLDALLRSDGPNGSKSGPGQHRGGELDLSAMIDSVISHVIRSIGKPVALMDKREKTAVVASLSETGVFLIRGSVQRVARALGISRFTVYNYLKEARRDRDSSDRSRTSHSHGRLRSTIRAGAIRNGAPG